MSRISTIVSQNERKNMDNSDNNDSFIYKFSLLLVAIIILSAYIIVQGLYSIDNLSHSYDKREGLVSLESIERELNGNFINLVIVEDDFSELSSIDLSGIVFASNRVQPYQNQVQITAPVQSVVYEKSLEEPKKQKVFISSQEGDSLSFIKKKFYATNNSMFSMRLAKSFYKSKKYQKALKWTLITNEIDSKNEESWIMFAQIKVAQGKKQDAVNALNEYLKHENSAKAVKFLKKMIDKA